MPLLIVQRRYFLTEGTHGRDEKAPMKSVLIRTVMPCAAILIILLGSAMASLPVPVTITGCVIKGIIISEVTDFGSHTSEGKYRIRAVNSDSSSFDLTRYEGSRITVKGSLLPGDWFIIDPEGVKIQGPCATSSTATPPQTANTISSNEAEEIVWELPEVKLRADQVRKQGSRAFTRIESKPEPDAKPDTTGSAYTIYFGEDRKTHTVRLMTFLVDAYTRQISVYDVVTDSSISLEEWRKGAE